MSRRVQLYAFRTVRLPIELQKKTFVFGNLREDLIRFKTCLAHEQPDHIIGIGNASLTGFESRAINAFHGKKICHEGPAHYNLVLPPGCPQRLRVTASFCNWTAYQISHLCAQEGWDIDVSLLHLARADLSKLDTLLPCQI